MYCTTHALVGGITAGLLGNPVAAFAGGMVTHIVLDAVPHHDYHNILWGVIDFFTGLGLVFFLQEKLPDISNFIPGAIGGAIPDLEVVLNHLCGGRWRVVFPSHTGLTPHRRVGWPLGFWIQALLVLTVFICAIIVRDGEGLY